MEWKTVKLGEVCEILDKRRIPLSSMERESRRGKFPYYGAQGIIDYIDDYIFDEELLLVAEDGANLETRNEDIAIIASGKYWVNNHAHVLKDNGKLHLRLLHYLLNHMDITPYITGSAQPKLNQANLIKIELSIPDIETQRRIAAILSSLDDKIENNNRINRNLEAQAQALFKSWFVDFEPWGGSMPEDWKEGTLGDIIEERPKSKIQVNAARDVKGKYPFFTSGNSIYEYNEALVSGRNVFLNTGGAAGIEFYVGEASYSTDTWCIKGIDNFTDYLYLYLLSILNIINTEYFEGSALKHLKKKPFKERAIIIPNHRIINDFNKIVVPIFDMIMDNYSESHRLAALRDTLLPKLMKGEIAL